MVSGIIMASGFSRRMKKDKLLLKIDDKCVIERVLEACVESKLKEIILVYRKDELRDILLSEKIKYVKNENAKEGQSEAIKRGLENVDKSSKGFMFIVGDQPFLDKNTIDKLIDSFEKNNEKIIIPIYNETKGNPMVFPLGLKAEFEKLKGDVGGREIVKKNIGLVKYVGIENPRALLDMDTREEYEKLKGGL